MPDRLGDFLDNSEPSRHRMICPKCDAVVKANTALGVRFAMRQHRKHCPFKDGRPEEVTEPPDPRDPENVGEPEEYDAELARELAELLESDHFAETEDDMLLDRVGRGEDDRTLLGDIDMPEEEWELQDHLADIKEQTEDEPVPKLVSTEEAMKIIAEAKKKHDEEAKKDRPTQGEKQMAIADDAQQVALIGDDETANQAVERAIAKLDDLVGQLRGAGTNLTDLVQSLLAAADAAKNQAAQAGSLLGGETGETINAEGQQVADSISDAASIIADVDTDAIILKVTEVGLSELSGRIMSLRNSIKAAAAQRM